MEPTFQSATNLTFKHVIQKIEHLTFPPISKKVSSMRIHEPYTGVWAIKKNKVIGVILADINRAGLSEIFSFYVIPEERNKGIGTQLLSILEDILKKQSVKAVQSRYRSDWNSIHIIEKLLKACSWEKPKIVRIISEISIIISQVSPIKKGKIGR